MHPGAETAQKKVVAAPVPHTKAESLKPETLKAMLPGVAVQQVLPWALRILFWPVFCE
jgi:hypothetical protein